MCSGTNLNTVPCTLTAILINHPIKNKNVTTALIRNPTYFAWLIKHWNFVDSVVPPINRPHNLI